MCHATTCQRRANIILLNLNFSCVVVVPAAPNCFTPEYIILLGRQTDKKSESISTTGRFQWNSCVIRFPDEYTELNIRSTNTQADKRKCNIFGFLDLQGAYSVHYAGNSISSSSYFKQMFLYKDIHCTLIYMLYLTPLNSRA